MMPDAPVTIGSLNARKTPTGRASGSEQDFAEATATQGLNLMATAATRVWEELYITKKPAIEEVRSRETLFYTFTIFLN